MSVCLPSFFNFVRGPIAPRDWISRSKETNLVGRSGGGLGWKRTIQIKPHVENVVTSDLFKQDLALMVCTDCEGICNA